MGTRSPQSVLTVRISEEASITARTSPAISRSELQHEKRYREEFVFQLVSNSGISEASMKAWAAWLGVDLRQHRAIFVLELVDQRNRPDLILSELERGKTDLALHWPALLTAVISPGELAMLEGFEVSSAPGGGGAPSSPRASEN